MATCKDCIHHDLCEAKSNLLLTINDICELEYRTDVSEWWCKHFKPTADVAPKSEVAREIFAEIEKLHLHVTNEFDMRRYEELKKKYTEGE